MNYPTARCPTKEELKNLLKNNTCIEECITDTDCNKEFTTTCCDSGCGRICVPKLCKCTMYYIYIYIIFNVDTVYTLISIWFTKHVHKCYIETFHIQHTCILY